MKRSVLGCCGRLALLLLLLHGTVHAAPTARPPTGTLAADLPTIPTLTEVTRTAGIAFTYSWGDRTMDNIVEGTGSGCTWFDHDGDGWLDLYLNNGAPTPGVSDPYPAGTAPPAPTNRLYRNLGNGTFQDVTATARVGDPRYSTAALAADYDRDGDLDLYVTNYGRNTLYRNDGQGRFTDVTEQAGVGDTHYGMGGAWFDYDQDGDLDLFVVNYLEFDKNYRLYYDADGFPGPLAYAPQENVFYRNEGNGTFKNITATVSGLSRHPARGMGAITADFDDDGRPDLFVASDASPNLLYLNRGVKDGGWVVAEQALLAGLAYSASGDAAASMGGAYGDVNGDGRLDLVVPDNKYNNVYLNQGQGRYEDHTAAIGVAEISGQFWSWGVSLLDFENDGDPDLVLSNGHGHLIHETQECLLLLQAPDRNGRPHYASIGPDVGPFGLHKVIGRGLCTADYDNDGDQDFFLLALDQPSVLVRNDNSSRHHWLQVRLEGTRSNRDGIGARVTVRAGQRQFVAERLSMASFVSQHDPRLHFGLGQEARVSLVEVRWPSGVLQKIEQPPVDRLLVVREPAP